MTQAPKLYRDADSRLMTQAIRVSDPSGLFERAYCFLCGKTAGWVSKESSNLISPQHVVVTCDDCDINIIAKFGTLPMKQIPTEYFDAFGYVPEKKDGETCCGSTLRPSKALAP